MGSGKTSWAIEYMRSRPDEKFLYVTPYIKEIIRILSAVRGARQPTNEHCSKKDDLKRLLSENTHIIVCTHELFIRFDNNIRKSVIDNEYIIIMDEALQAISPYQSSRNKKDTSNDNYDPYAIDSDDDNLAFLQEKESVDIDDNDYVSWIDTQADRLGLRNPFFKEIRELALDHRLVYVEQKFSVVIYPHEIFRECKQVYIMTYLFEASIMYYYLKIFEINFLKKSIRRINGEYQLVNYFSPDTSEYQNLIEIIDNSSFNKRIKVKNNYYSSTWSKKANQNASAKQVLIQTRNNFYNLVTNRWRTNESSGLVLWTCIGKTSKNIMTRKGINNCFVAVNCRATNDYCNVCYMGYFANIYGNVPVKKFIESKGLLFDDNLYALSEMLQFLWRGCIRRNELLHVYIPSPRMRTILCDWLGVKMKNDNVCLVKPKKSLGRSRPKV